jgi:hypothetical protein
MTRSASPHQSLQTHAGVPQFCDGCHHAGGGGRHIERRWVSTAALAEYVGLATTDGARDWAYQHGIVPSRFSGRSLRWDLRDVDRVLHESKSRRSAA